MTITKKQGRKFSILAALAGAALFLLLVACNGDKDGSSKPEDATGATLSYTDDRQVVRSGIGPDQEGGLMYEEEPFPGFSDYVGHIDFALSQALQRSGLDIGGLKVGEGELQEHEGHFYHPKNLDIYEINDIRLFIRALRDSMLAWAERAVLVPKNGADSGEANRWLILLDGAVTHTLALHSGPGVVDDSRPRLVIVIDDIGESKRQVNRLLALDFPVTFAIWPHSTHGKAVANTIHEAGAEVIIHQPMEPEGYPRVNPGEGVLLAGMSEAEILAVLEESLSLVPHAIGMNNHMGSRLTQDEEAMRIVSRFLRSRGFLMLDSLTHARSRFSRTAAEAGGPAYRRDIFLDVEADKEKVLIQLRKAEQLALLRGQAIAIGHPLGATLDALEEWEKMRDRQIAIVRLRDLKPLPAGNSRR